MKPYKDSPLSYVMDRLYERASSDYMSKVGIPDPKVRDQWVGNHVYKNKTEMDAIAASVLMDIENHPRIDEFRSLRLLSH